MTLSEALDLELRDNGAIRFVDGRAHYIPGATVRWMEGDAADEDFEAGELRGRE